MHQCIKFILFWNDTLHVSDSLLSIVRSSGRGSGYEMELISYPLASGQQYLFNK